MGFEIGKGGDKNKTIEFLHLSNIIIVNKGLFFHNYPTKKGINIVRETCFQLKQDSKSSLKLVDLVKCSVGETKSQ